jgi:hypothetical protein
LRKSRASFVLYVSDAYPVAVQPHALAYASHVAAGCWLSTHKGFHTQFVLHSMLLGGGQMRTTLLQR